MAYKALYRIYRPTSFEDFIGQKYILQTIKNQIRENKISHAYLFSGPRGTGKTSMAKLLAKAVNCESEGERPCNKCDNCLDAINNVHPDIIEIDAASNTGVDQVRDIIENVKYAPTKGKYKVYIIDEVHMMSTGAFNALLKTLEEPPAHVIFILATTEVHKLLPTILSRCQRFDFTRLSDKDLATKLKEILSKENKQYEDGLVEMIVDLADGGARDAISILDQMIAYSDSELKIADLKEIYGLSSVAEKKILLNKIFGNDVKDLLKEVNKLEEKGIDINRLTIDLLDICKDLIIYEKTKDCELLKVLKEDDAIELLSYSEVAKIYQMVDILIDAINNFKRTNNPRSYFELSLLKMANLYPQNNNKTNIVTKPVVKEVEKEVIKAPIKEEKIENEKEEKVEVEELKEEKIEVKKEEINENDENIKILPKYEEIMNVLVKATKENIEIIKKNWPLINGFLGNPKYGLVVGLLSEATPVAACDKGVILVTEDKMDSEIITTRKNKAIIRDFLKNLCGYEMEYYPITKKEFINYRNEYLQLRQAHKLPNAFEIVIDPIAINNEKKVDEALDYGKKIFGDFLKIEED